MKHLSLRLGDDLHARVKGTAEADKRTLNAQVEWLLEAGLKAREQGDAIISGQILSITNPEQMERLVRLADQIRAQAKEQHDG